MSHNAEMNLPEFQIKGFAHSMHIDTKLTEVPELHLYPAVDKYRKRKLMQDNATENVT